MSTSLTRRQFVCGSAAAAVAMPCPGSPAPACWAPTMKIRMAVIGCGVRGGAHVAGVRPAEGRADRGRLRSGPHAAAAFAKTIEKSFGYKPDEVVDVRRLMDRKDLDVVSVATMQYWHALPTIWACQTGRHVYVREAAGALHLGRPADGPRRAEVRPPGADRHAEPFACAATPPWPRGSRRATWARSSTSPASPTSRGTRSANAPSRCPSPKRSTTNCGAARPARSPSTATNSSTIAASPGTWATASRATRACTRWTSPAGFSATRACRGGR